MRSQFARRFVIAVVGLAMLLSTGLVLTAQSPTTAPVDARSEPAPVAPGTQPADGRQMPAGQPSPQAAEAMMEIQQAAMEMQQFVNSPDDVTDPAKRQAVAEQVVPVLKRMIAGAAKLEQADPDHAEQAQQMQMQFRVMAATFGDDASRASLQQIADAGGEDGARGQAALLLVDWFRSDKDVDRQNELLNRAEQLAKDNPKDDTVTEILLAMTQIGAANEQIDDRAQRIATGMESEVAQQAKARLQAQQKLESAEGKPMTIAGTTVEGKPFSTADWKGKVILVDFWATWCGPCIAELPRVKQVYAQYHDKGFEILGVSNDYNAQALRTFMQQHPDMPWPQIFDAEAAQRGDWHPVTMSYGIEGIPTMFLIDRKGVCRTINARADFEELIPKLLEESE